LALGLVTSLVEPAVACGCGVLIPRDGKPLRAPVEQAILRLNGGLEDMLLTVQLDGTAEEAAMIIPTPTQPTVRAGTARLFSRLDTLTQPVIERRNTYVPVPLELLPFLALGRSGTASGAPNPLVGSGAPPGATLLQRTQIGIYDVSILSATNAADLNNWLATNGYQLPDAIKSALDAYVHQGWYYVAVRLDPKASNREARALQGNLAPLWVTFPTTELVYPMRLSQLAKQPLSVTFYTLADHRQQLAGFTTGYAYPIEPASLSGADDALRELVDRPYFLTKLQANALQPETITGDLTLSRAASDEQYRPVIYRTKTVYVPIPATPLALGTLVLIGGFGYVLGRPWWSRRAARRRA
jgi:hypothetical protein